FMAIEMEDRFPILDILEQTPSISEVNQWALFLRNHDELTLEMVTDEERDYLYKMYADDPAAKINLGIRRRLAPLLGNNRRKIEVMNVLLFSLCGTPIIYYGDEIGMGNNYYLGDRNGVRTPMQWSADRNAGFSEVNPQKLYLPAIIDPEYHYEAVNVASEQRNSQSLWWWMKRLIHIRKRIKAFGRGNMFIVPSDNQKVLSFIRSYENEYILVLINLSRFSQTVTLDLSSAYAGRVPIELFGNQAFPMIQNSPSVFTFGPHDYFWLLLKQQKEMISVQEISPITELRWTEDLYDLFEGENLEKMEQKILPPYCQNQRWFSGKNRIQQQFKIQKFIPLQSRGGKYFILFIQVEYFDAEPEVYCLPLTVVQKNDFENMSQKYPQALVAQMHRGEEKVYLVDAVYDEGFRSLLLYGLIRKDKKLGMGGHFKSTMYRSKVISPEIQEWLQKKIGTSESVHSEILKVELSNTAITYENKLFLKLFRKIEAGLHPDMEIARYFADKNLFRHTPFLLGMLEYEREYDEDYEHKENILLALLENYIPNQGDGWNYSLDALRSYYERVQTMRVQMPEPPSRSLSYCQLMKEEIPPLFKELIGTPYLEMIRLLGKRTAEMHLALAGSGGIQRKIYADFAPEAFQSLYQRSLYQSMQSQVKRSLETLKRRLYRLPEPVRKLAQEIIGRQKDIISHYFFLLQKKMYSVKIRIHGDYHLGQVLFTGNDFYIIDFEGEPLKNLNERRFKRTPIRDIAGMLRSFQYAAYVALRQLDMNHVTNMEVWANYWQQYVGIYFLRSYLEGVGGRQIVPQNPEQLDLMLKAYILDKACYELDYELNNRPDWVDIPLKGIHLMLS
ncbi:MAG: putative maltokinase, partial [Candidatus Aureabacteria bacterium]|nr:putative maltokinase [Candidatus Auribacterota bacterium]